MREWIIGKDENVYECPYCHTEIKDWTGESIETHEEYCGHCLREFKLVVC